jgi:hypothetical protein
MTPETQADIYVHKLQNHYMLEPFDLLYYNLLAV